MKPISFFDLITAFKTGKSLWMPEHQRWGYIDSIQREDGSGNRFNVTLYNTTDKFVVHYNEHNVIHNPVLMKE